MAWEKLTFLEISERKKGSKSLVLQARQLFVLGIPFFGLTGALYNDLRIAIAGTSACLAGVVAALVWSNRLDEEVENGERYVSDDDDSYA